VKLGNSDECAAVDEEMYQRLVGKLIYLSHTRPDIAFAVSSVSQFMHNPREQNTLRWICILSKKSLTPYVTSQRQLVDILTKGLCSQTFEGIVSKLGMENTYSPA